MKGNIVFYDEKMEVPIKDGERVVKYDEVMYIKSYAQLCLLQSTRQSVLEIVHD